MTLDTPLPFSPYPFPHEANACVSGGFFGREGGVSKGIYESLNCGRGTQDMPDNILQNLSLVRNSLRANSLHIPVQTHSNVAMYLDTQTKEDERVNADALVTDIAGLGIGILTADCAPVLFAGKKENGSDIIAAAHAGWRGALNGILESTIDLMRAKDAVPESITAVIGPAIASKSYEVGEEFFREFVETDQENENFFQSGRNGKYHFDLPGFCAFRIKEAGICKVILTDKDTYSEEKTFFSYRRTCHRNERDYGRQISALCIR